MAVNMSRNLNDELLEGATDGAIKKAFPDMSNPVLDNRMIARRMLNDGVNGFGLVDASSMERTYAEGLLRHR